MDGYQILLRELKERIRTARLQAASAVNQELILLYWGIGREIMERQAREGWGSRVIDRLSADFRRDFPDMTGLSARNLKYMRALAETHPDRAFVQQVVARLPWGHVVRLMENVKDATRREWYARQSIEHGWSRNVLIHQIESNLYERQGKALTNFSRTLPAVQSELAQQLIKDPYSFDFLALGPDLLERDLERGLLEHLRSLILELGKGFAFVGSQYRLDVDGRTNGCGSPLSRNFSRRFGELRHVSSFVLVAEQFDILQLCSTNLFKNDMSSAVAAQSAHGHIGTAVRMRLLRHRCGLRVPPE